MRYLVQDSLVNFTQMSVDACYSVLTLKDDFTWGPEILVSPFKSV